VSFRPVLLAFVLALVVPGAASANSSTRIIVKRDAGLSAAERADIRDDAQVRFVETLPLSRTEVVTAKPGDVADALRDLNADADVVYAERDSVVRAFGQDSYFPWQWALLNLGDFSFGDEDAVHDADMDVPDAWDMSTASGAVVAVVDTGVDAAHEDLGGRVLPGWDFVDSDPYADDQNGHGTHVAGTIAATRDNDIGGAGVAPDARIVPIRVLGAEGWGYISDIVKGYDYAADRGIRLVNASLGSETPSAAEQAAIAAHPQITYIVAAGNGGQDEIGDDNDDADDDIVYPCAYNLANVVCVGASRHDDTATDFSNYGETTVDVFAPGYGIISTFPDDRYAWSDGTSMATPHVTGEAALLLGRNPNLEPADIKAAVIDSADYKNALNDLSVSDGRANANAALLSVDDDGDSVVDGLDNCPAVSNPGQEDADSDEIGDACPPVADADADGVPVPTDLCPDEAAAYAANGCPSADPTADGDYWPNALDQCLAEAGTARGCPDGDRDGVADRDDNCPATANANQADSDSDGQGNACDADRDGDNVPNAQDQCPDNWATGTNGCAPLPPITGTAADADRDGVSGTSDACPKESAKTLDGCPLPQVASLSAKAERRSATVKVRTTRVATIKITVERKKGRRWVRVARRTVGGSRATMKLSRLKRGTHRVRISMSSSAGRGDSVSKTFRVR
jgi:thermitase